MVHSTGANNPNLSRYVQPNISGIGVNKYNNDWNRSGTGACVHAFIGKLANGNISWDVSGNIIINQGVGAKFNADGSGQLSDGNITWDSEGNTKIGGMEITSAGIGTNSPGLISESTFIGKNGTINAGTVTNELVGSTGHQRFNTFKYNGKYLSIESVGTTPNGGNPDFSNLVYFKFENVIFKITRFGIEGSKDGGNTWVDLLEGGGSSSGGNLEFVDSLPPSPDSNKLYVIV
jgi:hypothetical protein